MDKILKNITYYSLILLGLAVTSWILWARFIRERTIRDIPDGLFTEYRFWFLLYLCGIYLYMVKNLIKPKESNEILYWLSELFFTPLKTLDHSIKYNYYIKPHYYRFMRIIINYFDRWSEYKIYVVFLVFQIIPRGILVFFLLLDTFYFFKLELLYKVILIGLLPFALRYCIYSIKDFYDHWIKVLEYKYDDVQIYEKGYEGVLSRKDDTSAIHHYTCVSIKEYIEIKYNNILDNLFGDNFPYEYVGIGFSKEETLLNYTLEKYHNTTNELTTEDYKEMKKLFEELMPQILDLHGKIHSMRLIKENASIKWSKVIIFTLYFICWSFILTISYYCYPIKFEMFKYLCDNIILYLCIIDEPFSMLYGYSLNENLVTLEKMQLIGKYIIRRIFRL